MRVAVIGAGVAGLGAAWALSRRHAVVLYEAAESLGGHANTELVEEPGGAAPIAVDTGFIVLNDRTYPNLRALFARLDVPTRDTTMSFAVSLNGGRTEYSGDGIAGLFAQKRKMLSPRHWGMIRDLLRFYREAPGTVDDPAWSGATLGQYLAEGRYSRGFLDDHLLPMSAAIWSCTSQEMLGFPLASYVRFCVNHGLLQLRGRPQWMTVEGGSRRYVDAIARDFAGEVRLSTPAARVIRTAAGVVVDDHRGGHDRFDQVVLACHADQALALIDSPEAEEEALLGSFRYSNNAAVLHQDRRLLPRRERVWSSWNYMGAPGPDGSQVVSVSYWMNRLQGLASRRPLVVSLNPLIEPDPALVHSAFTYTHPIFDDAAIAAQRRLGEVQGRRGLWFCGSYCGHGFHEDGLAAGLAVAESLGAPRPWRVVDVSPAFAQARARSATLADAAA